MINKEVVLSASKIKTAKGCSMRYYGSYVLKLPDSSNEGAKMGDASHIVLECLAEPRRHALVEVILLIGSLSASSSIDRLINKIAKRNEVDSPEQIEKIRGFIMNGLKYDFFGRRDGAPDKSMTEQEFKIEVKENGLNYKIRGFIDRLFIYGNRALIRDYKTSKETFQGGDLDDNTQAISYCLAVMKMFPEVEVFDVEFLFLKFDCEKESLWETKLFRGSQTKASYHNGGGRVCLSYTKDEIEGFQYELTGIQQYLEEFGDDNSCDSLARDKDMPKDGTFSGPLMCGRADTPDQLKKDGTKMWYCPYKFAFDYYCIVDHESDQTLRSATENGLDDLKVWLASNPKKDQMVLKKKRYNGCPAFSHLHS